MIRSIAGSIARPLAVAITGASGGAAPAPVDTYAANSFSPDYVADFSAASADYFRVAGSDSDFATAFTSDSEGGGLATMVDSSGNLVWRAHNLLTYSEQFDNAAWTKFRCTVTANSIAGPDGTNTADETNQTTSQTTSGAVRQETASQEGGALVSHACFFKKKDKSFAILGTDAANATGVNDYAWFDLDSGTVGTIQGGMSASISSLSDGWYLCTVAQTVRPGGGAVGWIAGSADTDGSFTVTDSGGVYIWGAHVYRSDLGGMADNPDSVATGLEKYVPTTTAARYLARRRHHRWDGSSWVPTCLHEPVGAINEIINSANPLAGSWNAFNLAVAGTTLLGVDTAVEATLSGGNANHRYSRQFNYSATDYALAVIVSSTDVDWFKLTFYAQIANQGAYFDISTGTVGTVDSGVTAGMVPMGANTYLIWIAKDTPTGGTGNEPGIYAAGGDGTLARNDDGATFKMVGWQLAQATFPSSWIPTAGASVTRTADTLKGKAASFPWSSTAVSMAIKGRHNRVSGTAATLLARYEDADDALELRVDSSDNAEAYAETGGSSQTASGGAVATGAGAAFSLAMRYVAGSAIQVATGGTAGSEVTASVPATPPLSDDDVLILEGSGTGDVNGTVDRVIGWDEDIATAGLEETSA